MNEDDARERERHNRALEDSLNWLIEETREHRKTLAAAFAENSLEKDKIVISISGVALGLSAAFLQGEQGPTCLLIASWVSLGMAMIAVLASFLTTSIGLSRTVDNIDRWLVDPHLGGHKDGKLRIGQFGLSGLLDGISIVSLIIGIGLLVATLVVATQ